MFPTSRSPLRKIRFSAILCLVTAVVTVFAATAEAAPQRAAAPTYDASWNASALTLTVHNASVSTENGNLTIRDTAGAELFRMPLMYRSEYRQFPIDTRTTGNKVTLIPSREVARSTALNPTAVDQLRGVARHNVAAPQTRQERDDQALDRFRSQLSAGTSIGTLVGTVVGGIIGGALGCFTGALAGFGIGCPIAIPFGTAAGALAGLALAGGGTLIGAGIHYFQTINSPFTPPRR
ncbi:MULTISPECIES: glycine zipper family protein [unclassified Gordonia (in: high G+C Gram-positive bacteria)]|uniref:glycine zipper family protein n=1 Tax=unclassified Gordonia (in: high G+C Gram-positive bacteria) TaxID=2657482 RepID=UPI0010F98AB2|nr:MULTISPECIES: glycine zipper family protein [unclassified Gordonia (in: high G+C Gram-positive bacteria)]WGJ84917.1 glycine zipper family protein [Gordonia sp. SMJS1]